MMTSVDDFTGQGLVSDELFEQLERRIVWEQAVTIEYATRIVDQALAFLAGCAKSTEPLSLSSTVDNNKPRITDWGWRLHRDRQSMRRMSLTNQHTPASQDIRTTGTGRRGAVWLSPCATADQFSRQASDERPAGPEALA